MNYLAILVGAIIPMIMGAAWYHPKLFGNTWMKGAGLTEEDVNNSNPMIYFGAFLLAAIMSYGMSRYAGHTEEGMSQFVHGMFHGIMPAALLALPVLASNALFEKKSVTHILINCAYWALTLALMGGAVYALTTPNPIG